MASASSYTKILWFLTANLLLLRLYVAESPTEGDNTPMDGDAAVDMILEQLTTMRELKIDPINMIDVKVRIMGMDILIYNGEVRGLSALRRAGKCLIYITTETIRVISNLGSDQLTAKCNVKLGSIDLGTGTTFNIKSDWSQVESSISVNLTSKKVTLDYIKVKQLTGLESWVDGPIIFKNMIGPLSDRLLNVFVTAAYSLIEQVLEQNFDAMLQSVPLPL